METKQFEVAHTDAEWRKLLTPEQYEIMRGHGTERPGSCALNFEKRHGTFACAGCGQQLFTSKKKFESGTGWPSFNDPASRLGRDHHRPQLRHGPHRGALQPLRQPSRPRLRRRPAADPSALLHQRRGDEFRAGGRLGRGRTNRDWSADIPHRRHYSASVFFGRGQRRWIIFSSGPPKTRMTKTIGHAQQNDSPLADAANHAHTRGQPDAGCGG